MNRETSERRAPQHRALNRPAGGAAAAVAARRLARRLASRRRPAAIAGAAGRWASWARSIAGRFRAGRGQGGRGALALHLRRWAVPAPPSASRVVERLVERTAALAPNFASRLYLTLRPLLVLGRSGGTGPASSGERLRPLLAGGGVPSVPGRQSGAGSAAAPGHSAAVPARRVAPARPAAPIRQAAPLLPLPRALAQTSPAAGPAARTRLESPAARGEHLVLARRIAARGRRLEARPERPAERTLVRQPARPAEAAVEPPASGRRRPPASAGVPTGTTAAAALAQAHGELDRLTDQVVRRIDRRMAAWRERTGRVR